MIRLVPFLAFAYVVAGLMAARSEAPIVFGRYSYQAAALIAVCLLMYLAVAAALRRRDSESADQGLVMGLALVTLVALTFVVTGSNAVQRLPLVEYVLPAVRVLAAVALIALVAARARAAGAPAGPLLGASMVLLVWASGDFIIAAATRNAPPHAQASSLAFREPVDLRALPRDAVVLIGDSFVWGQGVEVHETFGAQLEGRLRERGRTARVQSLGVVGAGLRTYLDVVASLPRDRPVDRIALVFYMNDMPAALRLTDTFRNQMITLGVGSPTLRIVGDLAGRRLTPTLDAYHAQVARDYDAADPTYPARWATLGRQLREFAEQAATRSRGTPLLVVLPLMVDFASYPLGDAHERLGDLGRELGYEVVDLLPVFRDELGDGGRHRVSPQDNHFDPATHAVVARALAMALANP
jgi:lysophospholipase L1-like esterase